MMNLVSEFDEPKSCKSGCALARPGASLHMSEGKVQHLLTVPFAESSESCHIIKLP